jgi:acetolactate synthase I/II/III large subunit
VSARIDETAAALVQAGVGAVFGVPGSGGILALITALETRGLPFHGAVHEGAAAIMAAAFARQSGRLGCALSIRGPGLVNMIPGLFVARTEGWPLVTISEAYGPGDSAHRMHKRLDQPAATSPFTKAHRTLGDPSATIAALAATARKEVPGPVHLDLVAGAAAPTAHVEAPPAPGGEWRAAGRRVLESARRPVVIAGSLATRAGWGSRLARLRVPLLTTVAAKGLVDETSRYAAGIFTGDGGPLAPETAVLAEADVVVGLGLRPTEVLGVRPFSAPLVHLDVVATPGVDGWAPVAATSNASPAAIEETLDLLETREWGGDRVQEARRALRAALLTGEWLPAAAFDAVREAIPGVRLVVDTGLFCTVAEHVWEAREWRGFLGSANGRHMGTALPMALGAAIADRAHPVVCAVGDGGWAYASELALAVSQRFPLLLLFLSDGRYGSLAAAPSAANARPEVLAPPAASWVRAVEGLGWRAHDVSSASALDGALRAWDPSSGPLFLQARFDPARYLRMTERIR